MTSKMLADLHQRWGQLETATQETQQLDPSSTAELKEFLAECIDAGQQMSSPINRDRLQLIAREVGDKLFWATKEYLSVTIKPPLRNDNVQGAKEPIHNLPHERNDFFTDRNHILEELHRRFFEQSVIGKPSIEVISGLGGVGKTQTAIEYAYKYFTEYEYILFLNADSDEDMRRSLEGIAECLQLPLPESSTWEQVTRSVEAWLTSHRKWLLLIDNAENTELIVRFLTSRMLGHIILTSRKTVFDTLGVAKPITMAVLSSQESVEFLLKRTNREDTDEDERKAAAQLADELGHLPLALEQAGAYINEQNSPFQNYLKSYRKRGLALLRSSLPVIGNRSPVHDTWNISFKAVEEASRVSAELLSFSAFLSSSTIPLELITEGKNELGEPLAETLLDIENDPLILDELLKPLISYSFIRRDHMSNTYSIHHLVQDVLRDKMDVSHRSTWAERVVRALSRVFPSVEYENWGKCDRLLPHARVAARWVNDYTLEFEAAAHLLNLSGRYLGKRAQYESAEVLVRQSLDIRQHLPCTENPDIASSLTDLARIYRGQGRNKEAEPLYQQALDLRRQQLGDEHSDVAASVYNLARLYYYQARYSEAEDLFLRVLDLRKKIHHETNKGNALDIADSLNSLARVYEAQGRYGDAEPKYQEALTLRTKLLGQEHPDVTTSLDNLASLYEAQGNYREAEHLYRKALTLRQRIFGENHTDLATSLNNLANLCEIQANYEEAETLYKKALALRRQLLGERHPAIAQNLSNLADLYDEQGRFEEAESLYQDALDIYETLDLEHPDCAKSLNNLADLYRVQGRYESAEHLYNQALELRERLLGENHPDTVESRDDMARLYRYQGRYDEAEPIYTDVLELSKRLLGEEHPDVARSMNNLARLYFFQGRTDEAEPLFLKALELRRRIFGEEHPDVATSLNNLALLRVTQKQFEEAESLHQQALDLQERLQGEHHPDVAGSLSNLAALYRKQGRYEDAEPLNQRALELRQNLFGREHPDVARDLNNLALIYFKQHRLDEAEPLCDRALAMEKKILGTHHPDVGRTLDNLAMLYAAQNRRDEAAELYNQALEILRRKLGDGHPWTIRCRHNIATLEQSNINKIPK